MLISLALLLIPAVHCVEDFVFPKHRIQILEPKGFKVFLNDVEGASLFAVHINVNREIEHLEAGDVSVDIVKKKNGRWTYHNKSKTLKKGDSLHYWLYIIVNGLGYRLDNQKYVVGEVSDDGIKEPSKPKTTTSERPNIANKDTNCTPSPSEFDTRPPCSGQVMFHDDFSGDLEENWSYDVRFSDAPESDFTVWTNDFNTSGLSKGKLFIRPKLLEDISNDTYVSQGTLQLKSCTSRIKKNCQRSGISWSILPPIVSSRITTKNSFSFLYGEVEIRAKLPTGDWIVPQLWLEPKEVAYGAQSGRMFLGKAVGNPSLKDSQNNEIGGKLLQQGFSLSPKRVRNFQKKSGTPWSSDYHVYKLRWAPDSISFFVDGEELGRVAPREDNPLNKALEGGTPLAPFDREFYLNLGVHVGGREDFPDGSVSGGKPKPWENDKVKHTLDFWRKKDDWYPTWETPHNQLTVDYVKVTAL
uniref:Beta-1,3-glucan-binding protein n=2 Tax=Lygus hesperus TaxID=30085 RepID=A0A146M023_LYGHE